MTFTSLALRSQLLRRGFEADRLAREVSRQPELLVELFEGLSAKEPAIKYGSAKVLRSLSQLEPAVLYAEIDVFLERLDCENKFLRCDALLVLSNLARVDVDKRLDRVLDAYFAPIGGPEMMIAATAVKGGATMAEFRPELTDRIVAKLLGANDGEYKTAECREVVLGHVIDALLRIYGQVGDSYRQPVRRLVHQQLESPRAATRKKAAKFLSTWTE